MPLRDDLLSPIAGPSPGGIDLSSETIYVEIEEARRGEMPDPIQVEGGAHDSSLKKADYAQVIKLASEALATQSKDLQVAVWLTEALLHCEGFKGLGEGLVLLRGLLEQFWEHLYPDDIDYRRGRLDYVGGYLEPAVKSVALNGKGHSFFQYKGGDVTAEEFGEALEGTPKAFYKELASELGACLESVKSLDQLSQLKFPEDPPNYRNLRESIEEVQGIAKELLARKLEMDPDPPDVEDYSVEGAAGMQAGDDGSIPVEPVNQDDAAARIAAAAHFLQRENPTSPASYLMLRGFRWGELRAQGGTIDPRLLSAPPTQLRTRLKGLLLDENWEGLLAEGERVMATPHGRGWLDLQRYVISACDHLGTDYAFVGASIRRALASLLRDLPQLPELTLMDDTSTANEETRRWLEDEGLVGEGIESAAPLASGQTTASSLAGAALGRAMAEVRAGRPEKGVEILMREADREKSERARFMRRSQIAAIMVDAGLEKVARPILKEMAEQIDAHNLEDWEAGDVVARPLGLLYRCMAALGGESDDEKQKLYKRICRLDPLQAMAFPSKSKPSKKAEAADKPAKSAGSGESKSDEEPTTVKLWQDDGEKGN